jgi:hypothetical protein
MLSKGHLSFWKVAAAGERSPHDARSTAFIRSYRLLAAELMTCFGFLLLSLETYNPPLSAPLDCPPFEWGAFRSSKFVEFFKKRLPHSWGEGEQISFDYD